jgi:hypothetical protein
VDTYLINSILDQRPAAAPGSQAKPPKKAKNAFPQGLGLRPQEAGHADAATGRGILVCVP